MVELQVVLPDESAVMAPERLVELAAAAEELGTARRGCRIICFRRLSSVRRTAGSMSR